MRSSAFAGQSGIGTVGLLPRNFGVRAGSGSCERFSLLMQTLIRQNRDLRIDLFRGIALWSMFIDHLLNGSLGWITLKQYGFCDAAELFVLLSGVSAGMVYGRISIRKGVVAARLK